MIFYPSRPSEYVIDDVGDEMSSENYDGDEEEGDEDQGMEEQFEEDGRWLLLRETHG